MKKALAILSAVALVATAATAEVKVGGWGRIGYTPASGSTASGSTINTYSEPSWASGGRVGVNFNGSSDNVGFSLNIDSNGNTLGVGDQAKIWVKLSDMFKFEVGKVQGDVLRGKIGDFGLFGDYSAGGEDDIFARFYPSQGFLANITPVEGLYLGAALDTKGATASKTEDAFKKIQVGAGYTIANVGLIRAQYIGTADKDAEGKDKIGKIGIAFNLTAVQGLNADIGATIDTTKDATQVVAAGVGYSADALSVTARVKANIATKFGLGVAAKVDYAIAAPFGVGATVGYNAESDMSKTGTITAEPFVKLGYSNGYAAVGIKVANDGTNTTWVDMHASVWV
jgi:hypothetical protein